MESRYSEIVCFIRKVFKKEEGVIYLHEPHFMGNEKKYLLECIDSTYVSSVGKFVDKFEELVADYTGAKRAVVCVNGTNALHMALLLVGVNEGDEVIMQPLTFIATANAISYINAKPVFIDVDKDTMGLSPTKMEDWLSQNTEIRNGECFNKNTNRRIKACVPMHTFGHPVHIEELNAVCNKYFIELVEDAAESLGSFYKGRHTGTFGKVGVLSFNGNKTITTGGGGMLLFQDQDLAKKAKHLSTQAKVPHRWDFVHDSIGYNYRMPNLNAALGCAQMESLKIFLENKRLLAEKYAAFFAETEVSFFKEPAHSKSNYWLNTILFEDKSKRDAFLEYSNNNGIMTRPIWSLMHKLPMFENEQRGNLENAEWFEPRVVNIPSSVIL